MRGSGGPFCRFEESEQAPAKSTGNMCEFGDVI